MSDEKILTAREKKHLLHSLRMAEIRNDPEKKEKKRQTKIRHYLQQNLKGIKMIQESIEQLKALDYSGPVAADLVFNNSDKKPVEGIEKLTELIDSDVQTTDAKVV